MPKRIWTETQASYPALVGTVRADAVVIGGGLTGLMTAWRLQEAGLRTIVLEAGYIGSGQSGGTTAKVTMLHGLYWAKLARRIGQSAAHTYALAQQTAVDAYAPLTRQLGVEGYEPISAVLYTRSDPASLRAEAAFLASCGLPAEYVTECALPAAGAVRLANQAQLEPGKLMAALAQRLTVFENSRVLRIHADGVDTISGKVRASLVVFADHFPMRDVPGLYFMRMHQNRADALLLDTPAPAEMYISADRDAPNLRGVNGRTLLSGGSRRIGSEATVTAQQMAAQYYPGTSVLAQWSAQDAITPDGLPYIGRFAPSKPNWYVATGYNGWGMSSAMLAADILTSLTAKRSHPAASIVSPRRSVPIEPLLQEFGVSLRNELTPGGPRCTHLGCRLRQNTADGSWECPCHGSRFDSSGTVLDGPAQQDLRDPPHAH